MPALIMEGTEPGRVLTPPVGALAFVDTTAQTGAVYVCLVHAFGATSVSVGHSGPVTIGCC